jgi:hypothetical protein
VWPPGPPAILDEGCHAAGLEGAFDLVEGVAVVAHDVAGTGDVAELLGEFEQRELASGTLGRGGHLGSSSVIGGWRFQFTSENRLAAAFIRTEEKSGTVGKLPNQIIRTLAYTG